MVALVTGAYKGLGLALCRVLAINGYQVILTARDLSLAESAALTLKKESDVTVFPMPLEVTSESQLQALSEKIQKQFGKIDLIINNAGINPKDFADKSRMAKAFRLDSLEANELMHVIHVNSIAPLLVVKHFRGLLKNSTKPIVINISSWLGSVTNLNFGGHYGYVGSKNLLNVFNKSMALEIKNDNIICVNVNPGWVKTDMGGSAAQFTTTEAAQNILNNIINKVSINQTGLFLNYDGKVHPF